MLPSELLAARVRKGNITPVFAEIDEENLELARNIIKIFEENVGKRRGELIKAIDEIEETAIKYRLVKGLQTLLLRRCEFEVQSIFNPPSARRLVFEEASKLGAITTKEKRDEVIRNVSSRLNISVEELEKSLFADYESEQVLKKFDALDAAELLKRYNLSLTQTLLFKATGMEVYISGNFKNVFRKIKHLGLMYLAEKRDGKFWINIEGPLCALKMTEKYGVALAKLLPFIIESDSWKIKASVVRKQGDKILNLELDNSSSYLFAAGIEPELYDSGTEERFSLGFNSLNTGWVLRREPEPLLAGSSVFIPDFSFEKRDMKFYMEIVGFWTRDYLNKKIQKLSRLKEENLIIAVDRNLACSRFERMKGRVIYYDKDIPLKEVCNYLKKYEEENVKKELEYLSRKEIDIRGEVVKLEFLAREQNASYEAVKKYAESLKSYILVGDELVAPVKLEKLKEKFKEFRQIKYTDAASILREEGVSNINQILELLGFEVKWHSLNEDTVMAVRKQK